MNNVQRALRQFRFQLVSYYTQMILREIQKIEKEESEKYHQKVFAFPSVRSKEVVRAYSIVTAYLISDK